MMTMVLILLVLCGLSDDPDPTTRLRAELRDTAQTRDVLGAEVSRLNKQLEWVGQGLASALRESQSLKNDLARARKVVEMMERDRKIHLHACQGG